MGSGQLAVVTGASSGIGLELAQPGSDQTMYNASKAFIQSFAEGLHDEFRGTGVSVTALMPGATDTEFYRRADMTP